MEFDTSNIQENNQHGIVRVNGTVVLKWKSETGDDDI